MDFNKEGKAMQSRLSLLTITNFAGVKRAIKTGHDLERVVEGLKAERRSLKSWLEQHSLNKDRVAEARSCAAFETLMYERQPESIRAAMLIIREAREDARAEAEAEAAPEAAPVPQKRGRKPDPVGKWDRSLSKLLAEAPEERAELAQRLREVLT